MVKNIHRLIPLITNEIFLFDSNCMTGQYGPRTVLVEMLSCIARENHIYLAANLGRQTKTASGNVRQYNTDVVFDRCGPPLLISYVKTKGQK